MIRSFIACKYEEARLAGLPLGASDMPRLAQRYFSNISGYEPAEFIRRLLDPECRKILVVGVGGGRDTHFLRLHGFEVISIDIVHQSDLPAFLVADMSGLPFRGATFDAVVVADALEHTFDDFGALSEFRRILRFGGQLVLNIPFGDDRGEHHVRVYTEATIRRLLEATGFRQTKKVYRGMFPLVEQRMPGARHVFHGLNVGCYIFLGRTYYRRLLNAATDSDWRHGARAGLRKLSRVHGAYIAAVTGPSARDFRELNMREYEDQSAKIGAGFLRRSGGLR